MSITKKEPKKKLSVAIKKTNFDKIQNIKKEQPKENTSSIIDAALDFSLEEVKELFGRPLDFQEELLKRQLKDVQKMKKGGSKR